MKYETPEAFRTALEQRLKNEAEATGVALVRLRKRVAFERFLARLAASEPGGWPGSRRLFTGISKSNLDAACDEIRVDMRRLAWFQPLLRNEWLKPGQHLGFRVSLNTTPRHAAGLMLAKARAQSPTQCVEAFEFSTL